MIRTIITLFASIILSTSVHATSASLTLDITSVKCSTGQYLANNVCSNIPVQEKYNYLKPILELQYNQPQNTIITQASSRLNIDNPLKSTISSNITPSITLLSSTLLITGIMIDALFFNLRYIQIVWRLAKKVLGF